MRITGVNRASHVDLWRGPKVKIPVLAHRPQRRPTTTAKLARQARREREARRSSKKQNPLLWTVAGEYRESENLCPYYI